jgi:hypothetical protein
MSLFLSYPCFDLFDTLEKLRLAGKIIDPTAQATDMAVVAMIRSSPSQRNETPVC